ncbi:unnamed protein product [Boreogadus saida]
MKVLLLTCGAPGHHLCVPIRLCALVQDGRGVFSVVQLQPLAPDRGELRQYTQRWQGRACALRNVKVVQRVTRERYGRAFHLIDSVWPPTIPFQFIYIPAGKQIYRSFSRLEINI